MAIVVGTVLDIKFGMWIYVRWKRRTVLFRVMLSYSVILFIILVLFKYWL